MGTNVLMEFVRLYGPLAGEEGPLKFIREVLGITPDPWQERVIRAFGRGERRISIRSCHGPGKTALAAWLIVYQLACRFPQKTACTAPTGGQLFDALYAEVKKWVKRLPEPLQALFDVKKDRIELYGAPEESFLSVRTARSDQPEALQGIHSDEGFVLLVVDEASGVPEAIFEAAAGSMSGDNCTTLLLSNPVRTTGFFFDTHHRLADMWFTAHISAFDSPRVTEDFVEDIAARYGENSNAYRIRVLGEFPAADEDTVIPFEWVEMASKRDVMVIPSQPVVWGLDVARFGDDRTALAKRKGNHIIETPKTWRGLDTMQVVGRIVHEWNSTYLPERPIEILVDVIGYGAGVADRLRELGLPARGVNVSESPAMKSRYVLLRDELWFEMREWFQRRDCKIPDDDDLKVELIAPRYDIVDSSGRVKVEPKKNTKKRLPRVGSPDLADAMMLTFAGSAATAVLGGKSISWNQPLRRNYKGVV